MGRDCERVSAFPRFETRHLAFTLCFSLTAPTTDHQLPTSRTLTETMSSATTPTTEELLTQAEAAHTSDPKRAEAIYTQILGTHSHLIVCIALTDICVWGYRECIDEQDGE